MRYKAFKKLYLTIDTTYKIKYQTMFYKIKYPDETFLIVEEDSDLDVIKKYDLATKENINTRLIQLSGEQLAIAIDNKYN